MAGGSFCFHLLIFIAAFHAELIETRMTVGVSPPPRLSSHFFTGVLGVENGFTSPQKCMRSHRSLANRRVRVHSSRRPSRRHLLEAADPRPEDARLSETRKAISSPTGHRKRWPGEFRGIRSSKWKKAALDRTADFKQTQRRGQCPVQVSLSMKISNTFCLLPPCRLSWPSLGPNQSRFLPALQCCFFF